MKKVLNFLKVQKYLVLALVSITVFVVVAAVKKNFDQKTNVEEQVKAIEARLPVKETHVIEVGSILPEIKDYFNDNREITKDTTITYYLNDKEVKQEDICKIQNKNCITNQINKYKVVIHADEEYTSSLMIIDTTAPEVTTKEVSIYLGDEYKAENFIKSYADNSGSDKYTVSYVDESQEKIENIGSVSIKLKVCDESENCTEVTARLVIEKKEEEPKTSSNPKTSSSSGKTSSSSGKTSSSSGKKSSSSGKTSSSSSSSSGSSTSKPKTCTEKDEVKKDVTIKTNKVTYGTEENTCVDITYHIDKTCKKEEVKRSSEKTCINYAAFNGTTSQMKAEAVSLYNSQASIRTTILNNTNAYRAEAGVSNLTIDYNLSVMATIRAMEMAYSNKFSHTRPSGKAWYTLWDEYGLAKAQIIGENLGKGYTTPDGVSKGWRNSPTHYENLINSKFTKVGIGKYTYQGVTYWAQEFSS